jgi:hypothetical protein
MRSLPIALSAALLAGAVGFTVAAAPPAEEGRPGRYIMQPADGGFLRLDTMTGDMSLCARVAGSFECKPVKDDRDLQAEVARLAAENKELKAEIRRLEEMLGLHGGPGRQSQRKLELPSEEDVDKALSYVERMFKKFRDKLKELEQPGKDGAPGRTTPL